MRKLKKFAAALLSAAMVLTTMAVPAMAAETAAPGSGATTVQKTADTIDMSKKGSLTIYKYETSNAEVTPGAAGTGESTDVTIPEGYTPLKDVGFSAWKIVGADKLGEYYSPDGKAVPKVSDVKAVGGEFSTIIAGPATKTGITDQDGKIFWKDMELGIYYVKETSKPSSVTSEDVEFVVGIPSTTADGKDWLYDVVVYPKNSTSYGGVTLHKTGTVGNGTATALPGAKFVLTRNFGSDWKYVTVTTENSAQKFDYTGATFDASTMLLTTDANGNISLTGLEPGTYRFIEYALPEGNAPGYIMDGTKHYTFTIDAKKNVTVSDDAMGKLDGTKITVNNEAPDLDKTVQDRTNTNKWDHDSDYSVGDTIPYKIVVHVPEAIASLKAFDVTDTPTNLDDLLGSIKIYDGETEISKGEGVNSVWSAAEELNGEDKGFKITFTPANMSTYAGKDITIKYNAVLKAGANITTAGNPNTAKLEYSNKIVPDTDEPGNPNEPDSGNGKDSISDEAIVYTFKIQVNKYKDSVNEANRLSGVKFELYHYTGTEENPTVAAIKESEKVKVNGENGIYEYAPDSNVTELVTKTVNADATEDEKKTAGTISVTGLENGRYYLVETETAAGYNLLKDPVKVELNVGYVYGWSENTVSEWTVDANGNKTITKHETTRKEFKFTNTDSTDKIIGLKSQDIVNKKGFNLPTTGGMGTIIFTVGGIALALAGVMIILASRKKTA